MDVETAMPSEEGWYWWRHGTVVGGKWRPVQVYRDGRSGRMVARGVRGGEWGPKLIPPPEPEPEDLVAKARALAVPIPKNT